MSKCTYAYDIIQVRPKALLCYPHFERTELKFDPRAATRHDISSEKSHVKGVLSAHARKRLKRAIELLLAQALPKPLFWADTGEYYDFLVNFVTLTLPVPQNDTTDDELKRIALNEWLIYAKRRYGLKSYIWKAETQNNCNLHFHLTTDTYIHWADIRKSWNHSLRHFGFIDQYQANMEEWHRDGFRVREDLLKHWDLGSQKRAYEYGCKTKWRNPNSTDVHAVNNIRDLAAYMIKYMCKKEEGKRPVQGKLWGCSKNLLIPNTVQFDTLNPAAAPLIQAFNDLSEKVHTDDHFQYLRLTDSEFLQYVTGTPRLKWEQFLTTVREYEYTSSTNDRKPLQVPTTPTEPLAIDLFNV